jgi:NAD(P)-dependent dehydrogenase (short-subunit alcohol dehydrogenase family)
MKNYLIIGGSAGIGLASAELLSKLGNQVFASKNSSNPTIENVTFFDFDVKSSDFNFDLLPEVIDGLIYCPGRINLKPFARIKKEDFLEDYEIQVLGAIQVIQSLLPRLKKAENGASIVLFSTVAVQMGFNFHSLVAASKGAIEGLTKALAAEFAPQIRVNAIAPSITRTPLASGLLNTPEKVEANAQRHPLKKIGEPEEIAELVAFLISEKSSWITGQVIHADGGVSSIKS